MAADRRGRRGQAEAREDEPVRSAGLHQGERDEGERLGHGEPWVGGADGPDRPEDLRHRGRERLDAVVEEVPRHERRDGVGGVPRPDHDAPQLAPAVRRIHRRTQKAPRTVTADRGYGEPAVERDLQALGVRTVAIPRKAKTSAARKAIEHQRAFRRHVKWRTGSEGRISYLKRCYGWDRTHLDGIKGTQIWCGHGVFAHNLVKIAALARSSPR